MENIFYTIADNKREAFYQIPKDLFILEKYAGLSNEARLLYGILKDRLSLSIRNNLVDDAGCIYFKFSRQGIADLLLVSLNTAKKRFGELRDAGLLVERACGNGRSIRLYLCKIDTSSKEVEVTNEDKAEGEKYDDKPVDKGVKSSPGQILTGSNFGLRPGQNLPPNNTNIIILNIYRRFNEKKLIVHRQLTENISKAIKKALKTYSEDEILKAIDNYAEVYNSDYFYEHKWSLDKFLKQDNGISRFTDEGDMWNSYIASKKPQATKPQEKKNEHEGMVPVFTFSEVM